jgi:uncharacterized pyridoxamine 5'-phosphate oxidase family protein
MTTLQRKLQMNCERQMNDALKTINISCDGKLDDKIKIFMRNVRSVSLARLIEKCTTIREQTYLISNFSSLYDHVNSDKFTYRGLNNSKPIDVSSLEENMVWDMRTFAMKRHNNWNVRNSFFKNGLMDEWYEIERRICLYTHSAIYDLNKRRFQEEKNQNKVNNSVVLDEDNTKVVPQRQKRCAAPKKVLRKRSSYFDKSSKIDRKDFTGGLRQRSAKLDCKRKLRQYYLENDE